MAYCRFSSDNWKSMVYAYETEYGYMVHVARSKPVGQPPEINFGLLWELESGEFLESYNNHHNWFLACEWKDIGLPEDGVSFSLGSLKELYDTLVYLESLGYYVPVTALNMIEEELRDDSVSESDTDSAGS